jgi:hypothetical protein
MVQQLCVHPQNYCTLFCLCICTLVLTLEKEKTPTKILIPPQQGNLTYHVTINSHALSSLSQN